MPCTPPYPHIRRTTCISHQTTDLLSKYYISKLGSGGSRPVLILLTQGGGSKFVKTCWCNTWTLHKRNIFMIRKVFYKLSSNSPSVQILHQQIMGGGARLALTLPTQGGPKSVKTRLCNTWTLPYKGYVHRSCLKLLGPPRLSEYGWYGMTILGF